MQPSTHMDCKSCRMSNSDVFSLKGLAYRSAVERTPLSQSMQLMGAIMANPKNTEIFGENEPADYLYKVVSGSVRTYNILSDGRRQVGGFYLPGDIFGLEFAKDHTLSAEATYDAKALVVGSGVR